MRRVIPSGGWESEWTEVLRDTVRRPGFLKVGFGSEAGCGGSVMRVAQWLRVCTLGHLGGGAMYLVIGIMCPNEFLKRMQSSQSMELSLLAWRPQGLTGCDPKVLWELVQQTHCPESQQPQG